MSALTLGMVAAVCWALHDTTIRYLSRTTPMMIALLTVLFFGLLFQTGVLFVSGEPVELDSLSLTLSIGTGIAFLVASVCLYFAFQRGPVRLVSPIIASYPILSLAFAIADGRDITLAQCGAVLAIVVGVGVVATQIDDQKYPNVGPTIALSVLSAIGFAVSFQLGQIAAEISGHLPTTLVARIVAFGLLALAIVAFQRPKWPGKSSILPLAIMGILDGIGLLAVISAGPLPNPEYAAISASMFGLLTVLLAWAVLGEKMSVLKWLGVVLAFSGVGYLAA